MATETTKEKIRIALQSIEDPQSKSKEDIFDLADLAKMMLALTKDYRAWLIEEHPFAADKDTRAGLRLKLYEIDDGSIEFILGVIGKAPLTIGLFKLGKWTLNLIHNFKYLANRRIPEGGLPLERAKTLKSITNTTNNHFYGPYIHKIQNERYSHSDIYTINETLDKYISEASIEDRRGFMRFVRIDGRDGTKQSKQEYVVIDEVDVSPFPLRIGSEFAKFKAELLQKEDDNPFTQEYEVDVRVIRDREGNIIEYVLLKVLGLRE